MTTASLDTIQDPKIITTVHKLQDLIESFINVSVSVHDNTGNQASHTGLVNMFNRLISQLDELSANDLHDYPIPMDIINYIEDGRNPDIYTREFVEVNARMNANLKGKMQNFEKLRDVLGEKVVNEFPELKEAIEDVKKRTNGI